MGSATSSQSSPHFDRLNRLSYKVSPNESQILSRIKVYRVLGGFRLSVLNLYRHQILNNGVLQCLN